MMNCCKTRPAKKEYGRPGAGRGKDPDLEDAIAGMAGLRGGENVFDPRVVNAACRSAVQGEDSLEFGARTEGRRAKNEIESKGGDGVQLPWWKVQLSENMTEAQLEAQERVLRGALAKARADEEKGRRTREVESGVMEDEWERRRRREFAKQTLIEEQHRRAWVRSREEQKDAEEGRRRRRAVAQVCLAEEVRRTEERLLLRQVEEGHAPDTPANRRLVEDKHARRVVSRRQRALFLAGVRVKIQYIRFIEHLANGEATDDPAKRSLVTQAILDLYTRDCLDPKAHPRASHREAPPVLQEQGVPSAWDSSAAARRQTVPVPPSSLAAAVLERDSVPGAVAAGLGGAWRATWGGWASAEPPGSGAGAGGGWPLAAGGARREPPGAFRPMPRVAAANRA